MKIMTEDKSEKAPEARSAERLKAVVKRVIIVVVFLPCLVIIAKRGGVYFLVFVSIVIFAGLWEFYKLVESGGLRPFKTIGLAGGVMMPVYIYLGRGINDGFLLTVIVLALMAAELLRKNQDNPVQNISVTILGIIYVGFLGSHLIMLRELPAALHIVYSEGSLYVLLVFILTWLYDTGAYCLGMIAGRHKLTPRISPGKTIEGAVGGVALTIIGILIARKYLFTFLGVLDSLLLAVIASVVGQFGDLAESMIKRNMKAKDSSSTIPGHGGILDRFDSMLFNAPVIYYLLKYFIVG